MNRAYSILTVKAVNDDQRVISGIATTPTPDRMGDIVEPLGVQFKNPMPLLWQHRSSEPVGEVRFGKPTKEGIPFEARLPTPTISKTLIERVDEAWESITLKLVKAVSIGFREIEYAFLESGGIHFLKSEVLELSLVTIPAQVDATIQTIKSLDAEQRAASGRKLDDNDRPKKPGASVKAIDTMVRRKEMDSMPVPASDETQQRFMTRCVDHMLNCGDDLTQAEANAHCAIRWDNRADMSGEMSASVSGRKATTATQVLAASGRKHNGSERTVKAGVTASRSTHAVKAMEAKTMKKTITEQIASFEATRVAKSARMDELMDASAETGETLDQSARDEYDGLEGEVKAIDDHLVRLRAREKSNKAAAVEVKGDNVDDATRSRGGNDIRVSVSPKKLPPGTMFTRYVLALTRAQGNIMMAEQIAKGNEQWMAETPDLATILKSAVAAGTTTDATWAGPLVNYQIMTQEFIDYLRPKTIIGRIPGLRKVPFKIKIPRQTGAATVNWVGEGKVKPLTSMAFDTITMEFAKIAGIIPLTEELVRFSSPSAEALVREELANAIIQFMDSQFVDPTKASNDVSPASITNGVTPTTATGTTAAAFKADIRTLIQGFLATNGGMGGSVWLMTEQQAAGIAMFQSSLGQFLYPDIGPDGGTLMKLPVVTSENIPSTGGSPLDGGLIILARARDILLADDGQVTIDASREASLQMDTAPDSPLTASTVMVSLWQNNMIAIKAERYINWAKGRSTSVAFIQNAKYAE